MGKLKRGLPQQNRLGRFVRYLKKIRPSVVFRYSSRAPTSEHWEPDSASDTLIFWNKDLECINDVGKQASKDETETSSYLERNELRSNEVCSPSESPYIPQTSTRNESYYL